MSCSRTPFSDKPVNAMFFDKELPKIGIDASFDAVLAHRRRRRQIDKNWCNPCQASAPEGLSGA
jgi:hypothetical protein